MSDNTPNGCRMIDTRSALVEAFRRRAEKVYAHLDLLVYPVEGEPWTRCAPDILVAPGCETKDRASFRYWEEPGPIALAGEFLSFPWKETLESTRVRELLYFYKTRMQTTEVFLFEPLGLAMDAGFRFVFLRRGSDGELHEVAPDAEGWYRSQVVPLQLRPLDDRIEIRDAETGALYLPDRLRADEQAERADEQARRAEQAEARVSELEAELRRLRGLAPE